MWCGYGLKNIITYNNLTNNRLESKNQKIKLFCGVNSPIETFVENLIKFMKQDISDSIFEKTRQKNTSIRNIENEPEILSLVRQYCSANAYKICLKNLKSLNWLGIRIVTCDDDKIILMDKFRKNFEIQVNHCICNCISFKQTCLPCEHLIFASLHHKVEYTTNNLPENYVIFNKEKLISENKDKKKGR